MVLLIGTSASKGYLYIFKFYSQLREKCRNQKYIENRQGFPIDQIQKNIIISIYIHWLQRYSHRNSILCVDCRSIFVFCKT